MFYIILLLTILMLFLIIRITIVIEASYNRIHIRMVLFRLIKITIVDKTKDEHGRREPSKYNISTLKKLFQDKKNFLSILGKIKKIMKVLLSRLQVDLRLRLVYGLSQPDKTAISYGVLNSFIYILDQELCKGFKRYKRCYIIKPELKKRTLDYNIKAEISFRILTLMPSIFKLLRIVKLQKRKAGMNDGRTSHRKLNENYNG